MADNSDNGFLYFMVGVLVIGLIGLGYFYYNGVPARNDTGTNLIIKNESSDKVPVPSSSNTTINNNETPNEAPAPKY